MLRGARRGGALLWTSRAAWSPAGARPAFRQMALNGQQRTQSGAAHQSLLNEISTEIPYLRLLQAVSANDVGTVKETLASGVNPNAADYDKRTPLHIAAAEGNLELIKVLLQNGAEVNVVDRWGNTPVFDAVSGLHTECVEELVRAGASVESDLAIMRILRAVAVGNQKELSLLLQAGGSINACDVNGHSLLHIAADTGNSTITKFLLENGADPTIRDREGRTALDRARLIGQDEIVFILEHYGKGHLPTLKPSTLDPAMSQSHLDEAYALLMEEGIFRDSVISQEIDWFYNNLRLIPFYFARFTPAQTAAHIMSYMAAKRVAAQQSTDIYVGDEDDHSAFFLCSDDISALVNVENNLASFVKRHATKKNFAFSLSQFMSGGVAIPYGSKRLALSVIDVASYPSTNSFDPNEADIAKVATKEFMAIRPTGRAYERYQDVMNVAVTRTSPVLQTYERNDRGDLPLVVAMRGRPSLAALGELTRIMDGHRIECRRKVVETFSNGIVITTLYLRTPSSDPRLKDLMDDVSLLLTLPRSKVLTPIFTNRGLTAAEYAYASIAKKFCYYFLAPTNSEEFDQLKEHFQGDDHHLSLLMNLRRKMKRDSVSEARIDACLAENLPIVRRCFRDFEARLSPDVKASERPELGLVNKQISTQIAKLTHDALDRSILELFPVFNASVRKTNFFKQRKAAVSVRLAPEYFIHGAGFDDVPHGVFMVVGTEFRGFHVRFRDVARGGIRIIRSSNLNVFAKNADSVFMENYNLAHTQNFKNKDIPEFGSKGTILLNAKSQDDLVAPFRKYISSLVDLLVASPEVVDHLGVPEILFLGPDENTADVMEWAALYARDRGYPFWKAFTTGKPPSLGGIPHDTYGMTTRSVHKFVVEALKKMGLKEAEVTKLQTGGPDGDLGCNEIKISDDKTVGIVDGSGVIFDPLGLDREELGRLANLRQTIDHFELGRLSPEGFRVLITENMVTLPNGRVVDSGLSFRNEFHLDQLSSADLFVPCGGRPEAVNNKNVHMMMDDTGTPRFKCIIEGANLFFTQEARAVLANKGAVLFKDASTNKGGVTSSSLEVLAALTLTDDEFAEHMCVQPGQEPPQFYKDYVVEVQKKIEENARLEFECIWKESEKGGMKPYLLTDLISSKINDLNVAIDQSSLYNDSRLRKKVLQHYIPGNLVERVGGMDQIEARLPENYLRAMFSSYLASRYIYEYGLGANEFCFFENMARFQDK